MVIEINGLNEYILVVNAKHAALLFVRVQRKRKPYSFYRPLVFAKAKKPEAKWWPWFPNQRRIDVSVCDAYPQVPRQ